MAIGVPPRRAAENGSGRHPSRRASPRARRLEPPARRLPPPGWTGGGEAQVAWACAPPERIMIFDLFHSISDCVVEGSSLGPVKSVEAFLGQAALAERLGMDTVWCAESHFSSEVQKRTSVAT